MTTSTALIHSGNFFIATVTLEAPATAGGVTVTPERQRLLCPDPDLDRRPGGATSVSFPVTTTTVKANTTVLLTASSPVNNLYANIVVSHNRNQEKKIPMQSRKAGRKEGRKGEEKKKFALSAPL